MAIPLSKRLNKYYIVGDKIRISDALRLIQDNGAFHINYIENGLGLTTFESDISKYSELKTQVVDFIDTNKQFSFNEGKNGNLDSKVFNRIKRLPELISNVSKEVVFLRTQLYNATLLEKFGLKNISLLNYRGRIVLLKSKREENIKSIRKLEYQKNWFYLVDDATSKSNKHIELINTEPLQQFNTEKIPRLMSIIKKRIELKEKRYLVLKSEYKRIYLKYGKSLHILLRDLTDSISREKTLEKIANEGSVFIISCFFPRDLDISKFEVADFKIIQANFDPREAPTVKPKKAPLSNFAFLTWLYGVPKYNEIEPSFTLLLTFPLLFGAIVGDVGYGLVMLIGAVILSKLNAGFKKNLFWIFFLSAISSIFFGFLFGEFFGNLIPITPILFYRLDSVLSLVIGSAFSGAVILTVAFVFNEINAILERNKKQMIGAAGWLLLNFVILLEVLYIYFYSSLNIYALFAIPISAILIGFGQLYELSQILNLFTNVVSYIRIAAVGLSSVMIAILINQLGSALIGYSLILAIFVMVILHLLNIILDSLIAFLQSLRLEYVEFLSKFLSGEGREYEPLEHVSEETK